MKKSAFTLIEIVVVIFIIATIAGSLTVSFRAIREKTRDTKRLSDIGQIQNALALYFRDEASYPETISFGQELTGTNGINYFSLIPNNPEPRDDGDCSDSEYTYTQNAADTYTIGFCLGRGSESLTAGEHCATAKGIENQACQ